MSALNIGVNYPWFNHGWDFGPAVDSTRPGWKSELTSTLTDLQNSGIQSVRWFVLADGWNFGTPTISGGQWDYEIPAVKAHTNDFKELLRVFHNAEFRLLPSLISHEFFKPGTIFLSGGQRVVDLSSGSVEQFTRDFLANNPALNSHDYAPLQYIKGGKASILDKRDAFFSGVLEPFLQATVEVKKEFEEQYKRDAKKNKKAKKPFLDVVQEWELVSEPDLAVNEDWVKGPSMEMFLIEGSKKIGYFGDRKFKATIGFQTMKGLKTFMKTAIQNKEFKVMLSNFIPQFHYFPDDGQGALPGALLDKSYPKAILGEFGTAVRTINNPWPPGAASLSPNAPNYANILKEIKDKGFERAYAWSYRAADSRSWWGPGLQLAVKENAKKS